MKIFTDGAAWGNPGPAGIGGVLLDDGKEINRFSVYLGQATNNEAEYKALAFALKEAEKHKPEVLEVCSDSQLLVRQIEGLYKVKSPNLRPLYEEIKILLSRFSNVSVKHIPREENEEADCLANQAVEKHHPRPSSDRSDRTSKTKQAPLIGFVTDFGESDGWVGICKGVINGINGDVGIIDISHDIPSFDIRKGAFVLAQAVSFVNAMVFLAVVDPGVGSARRSIVIETAKGPYLVGPDNGILIPASSILGGIKEAAEITSEEYILNLKSSTFQGRDVFSPAAAHLTKGVALNALGTKIKESELVPAPWTKAEINENTIKAEVIDIDKFGTVHLNATKEDIEELHVRAGENLSIKWDNSSRALPFINTYSDVEKGKALLLIDSSGYLSIAVREGSAQEILSLDNVTRVRIGLEK